MESVKCWILLTLLLYEDHHKRDVNAVLTVTPVETNATVGSQVRLNCSTDAGKKVNWQYGKELNSVIDVYIASEGMGRQYKKSNRHRVDVDTTVGQYDLVISNVTEEDDGLYICSEPGGRGTPPHARLTVTGGELPAKVCRESVVAIKGGKLQIAFSSCSPKPYFLRHVPVGLSHSNDVYNLGKLLNNYADSGRFEVDLTNEELKLKATNILLSDAGTYTCRGDSGHGDDKELVVLDEMPTCADNISDAECIATATEMTEVNCAVNYTGNCAPHAIWRYEYGNKSSSKVQQEFTCFSQTFSRAEMKTIIEIESGRRLTCHIESQYSDAMHEFQCNTSVAPEQCKEQKQHEASNDVASTNTSLFALFAIPVAFVVIFIAFLVRRELIRRRRRRERLEQIMACDSFERRGIALTEPIRRNPIFPVRSEWIGSDRSP